MIWKGVNDPINVNVGVLTSANRVPTLTTKQVDLTLSSLCMEISYVWMHHIWSSYDQVCVACLAQQTLQMFLVPRFLRSTWNLYVAFVAANKQFYLKQKIEALRKIWNLNRYGPRKNIRLYYSAFRAMDIFYRFLKMNLIWRNGFNQW